MLTNRFIKSSRPTTDRWLSKKIGIMLYEVGCTHTIPLKHQTTYAMGTPLYAYEYPLYFIDCTA